MVFIRARARRACDNAQSGFNPSIGMVFIRA